MIGSITIVVYRYFKTVIRPTFTVLQNIYTAYEKCLLWLEDSLC